ncbi:MAG TPA: sulfotransferase [Rhodanobacteraceae bacterium]|jgi:tetratricopeptide (TPR) repeat protein|nr:sulfotransferase [Rhodanobacteraceae bacterium]
MVETAGIVEAMMAAWNAGQFDQVIALAGQASATAPNHEQALLLLGLAQQQTSRHVQATETFTRLTRVRPDVSAYWNNLGVVCREAGDFTTSERALRQAMSLAPQDAEVRFNLGLLHIQQRRWLQAREALLDAVRVAPQLIEARLQAAYACHVCGDSAGEETMLEGVGDWPPQPAGQALILAAMLSTQGRPEAALEVLAQARLPEGPDAGPLRLRLTAQRAALYERNNRIDEARRELRHLPLDALDALSGDADQARVEGWSTHAVVAAREGRHAKAAALYRRALDLSSDTENRASAAFGLAHALDRQGRYRDAWHALAVAHGAQMELVRETAPELLVPGSQPLPMATRSVAAVAHARWRTLEAPSARQSPVFVVGFPRSGTTLLEQMLDTHPDFRSMDERGYVYELIERIERAGQRYPDDLANLDQREVDQLRAVYRGLVARVLPDLGQRRLVDKNPLNMLCLPMILRLFPAAPIIVCLRHPCDVLLSCSFQSFRSPAFMAMCSSLQRLARGYSDAFAQCWGHFDVFKPRVLEWRYESAVDDVGGWIARLAEYLALDDASPMLDFARHARGKRFIATPSYAQVTQPVNSAAVGRWMHYREQFEPVLPVLRPWIERFGYGG